MSRLTLRASDSGLNDENQTLFLSAGNYFNSNHKNLPNSITLTGQQRSELHSLTFFGTESKVVKSLVSGIISPSDASAGDIALPKSSLSYFLLRRLSLKPSVFLIPVELHFGDCRSIFAFHCRSLFSESIYCARIHRFRHSQTFQFIPTNSSHNF